MLESAASLASTPPSDLPASSEHGGGGSRRQGGSKGAAAAGVGGCGAEERLREGEQRLQGLLAEIGAQQQAFVSSLAGLHQRLHEEVGALVRLWAAGDRPSRPLLLPNSSLSPNQLPDAPPRGSSGSRSAGTPARPSHGSEGQPLGSARSASHASLHGPLERRLSEGSEGSAAERPAQPAPWERRPPVDAAAAAALGPLLDAAVRRIEQSTRDALANAIICIKASLDQAAPARAAVLSRPPAEADGTATPSSCGTARESASSAGRGSLHFLGAALHRAASGVGGGVTGGASFQLQGADATKQRLLTGTPQDARTRPSQESSAEAPSGSPRSLGVQGLLPVVQQLSDRSEDGSP